MRRRQKQPKEKASPLLNKELKRQGNVLTPLILALTITLVILMSSTDSGEPDIMLPEIQEKHKEDLINVPREQAQLEVDRITLEKQEEKKKKWLGKKNPPPVNTPPSGENFQLEEPFHPDLHNEYSLVQHIWYRGDRFDGSHRPKPINTTFPLAIDTLSVATEAALVTLEAQVSSWGSHHSIRYFFGATEKDDHDPHCATKITIDDMKKISDFCSGKAWKRANPKVKFLRNRFARGDFMVRFRKTPGWMCAQTRFATAIGKLGRFYRNEQAHDDSFKLPDFLVLQDDDTYFNMVKLYPFLGAKNPLQPTADAGCLVRMPVAQIAFDYPYGGFGLMLSQAAVERLVRPVDCDTPSGDDWEAHVCAQLQDNLIGESFAWTNGMSISDLMAAHAAYYPLEHYMKWRQPGYCIHGDWSLGYYVNYYNLAQESTTFDRSNNRTRIDQTLGYHYDKQERNCVHEGQAQCTSESHVCHRLHGVSMSFVARLAKGEEPQDFRKNQNVKKKKL